MNHFNTNSLMKTKINYGLEILRMLMSFWVIINHCYYTKNYILHNIIFGHKFHVPTFIIISFFFLYKNLSVKNINKIKNRLEKLFIPYLIYPILIWLINNLIYINSEKKIYFRSLIIQFIIGRGVHGVLWFHFNLIFITILIYIFSFTFNKSYLFIFQILAIISYLMQFSNINYNFFNKYSNNIKFSVGYLVETFPLAVTGLTLSSLNIIKYLIENRLKSIFFSIIFIFILFKYDIFILIKGFGKQGIMLNIGSILFFILFYLLPLEKIKISNIKLFIKYFTNHTAGIYFLHIIIYKILKNYIVLILKKTILGCVIIYVICYLVCFICFKRIKYTKLKYLFM